jgi:uncharacterized protein YdaU (DUF1376 family)
VLHLRSGRGTKGATSGGIGVSNNKPPAYQHYAKDFIAGTSDMSCAEVGAYIRLLDHAWDSDPIATLPDDDTKLRRLSGADPEEWAAIKKAVLLKFEKVDDLPGRLVNRRLRVLYEEREEFVQKASERGRKGAAARWAKNEDNA